MHPTTRPHSALGAVAFSLSICLLLSLPLFVATSCDNPADDVQKAQVSDPTAAGGENAAGATFTIDNASSKLDFIGSKVTASKKGGFKTFTGTMKISADGKSLVGGKVEIDMESTYSEADGLTTHLKSADFFDVPKFSTSTFEVTAVEEGANSPKQPNATHTIAGNLTLHGVTKGIEFAAEVSVTADSSQLKSEFAINRKDFDIVYAGKADDLIRDEVVMILDIRAGK